MSHTRRDFVATSAAGLAGLALKGRAANVLSAAAAQAPPAEDGYKLWLRYPSAGGLAQRYRLEIRVLFVEGTTPTAKVIGGEMSAALRSMIGAFPTSDVLYTGGGLAVGTPANSPIIRELGWKDDLAKAGPEGFVIRQALVKKRPGI